MSAHTHESEVFNSIKIDLNKNWTAHARSKGRGYMDILSHSRSTDRNKWGIPVTHTHVRGRGYMDILSHSRSTDRNKWEIRGKHEKAFQHNEYLSAENYSLIKFKFEKAHSYLMSAHDLHSKLIVHAPERKIDRTIEAVKWAITGITTLLSEPVLMNTKVNSKIISTLVGSTSSLILIIASISFLSGITQFVSIFGGLLLLGMNLKSIIGD